jgi:hypothetical protein
MLGKNFTDFGLLCCLTWHSVQEKLDASLSCIQVLCSWSDSPRFLNSMADVFSMLSFSKRRPRHFYCKFHLASHMSVCLHPVTTDADKK